MFWISTLPMHIAIYVIWETNSRRGWYIHNVVKWIFYDVSKQEGVGSYRFYIGYIFHLFFLIYELIIHLVHTFLCFPHPLYTPVLDPSTTSLLRLLQQSKAIILPILLPYLTKYRRSVLGLGCYSDPMSVRFVCVKTTLELKVREIWARFVRKKMSKW